MVLNILFAVGNRGWTVLQDEDAVLSNDDVQDGFKLLDIKGIIIVWP